MTRHLGESSIRFRVRVTPRASRSEVAGQQDGILRIRIAAAPVDGAANKELIRMLADTLMIPRSAISITAGHNSRIKEITVAGVNREALTKLFEAGM